MKHLLCTILGLGSLGFAWSQVADNIPSAGLIFAAPLNGSAAELVSNDGIGIVESDVLYVLDDSLQREVAEFNDFSSQIEYPAVGPQDEMTVALWVQFQDFDDIGQVICMNDGRMSIAFNDNNESLDVVSGTSFQSESTQDGIKDFFVPNVTFENQWRHITATFGNDSTSLFVDGQFITSGPSSESPFDTNILLGNRIFNSNVDYNFGGLLRDVFIWNRVLSPAEILTVVQPYPGCMDEAACNFDPAADVDDASCFYLDLDVPSVCEATSMLECSALVEGIDVSNITVVNGYNYIGAFEDSRYFLSQQSFSPPAGWNQQEALAQSLGGHLADIHSEEENSFIFNAILEAGWTETTWMGMTDVAEEGNWVWTSGQPVTYTNWETGEPNNAGQSNEHWMHMWGDNNPKWNDHRYELNTKCLIELPTLATLNWNNGQEGLTASYPLSATTVEATLIVDGTELCSVFQNILVSEGCNDPDACNYSENDSCNVSCWYGFDCEMAVSSLCGEGTVWDDESQTCIVANPSDSNFDGCVQLSDLLDLLSAYGTCAWQCGDAVSYEGHDYATVQIGEQCWFAENARYLPFVGGGFQEESPSISVYGYSGNSVDEAKSTDAYESFGALYNFPAVESVAICPLGWHVPAKEEFDILFDGYGGVEVAHLSMMDVETWNLDLDAVNLGYNVLPAGWLYLSFQQIQEAAFMWTSSPYGQNDPRRFEWNIQADNNFIVTYEGASQAAGKSVRCLKDNE